MDKLKSIKTQTKTFCFTIDDNIRFIEDLYRHKYFSLFSHPYTKLLKDLHEKFNVKIQLNLFYKNQNFTLSNATEKFLKEWKENSDWLKLSFHSLFENVKPYENSSYEEVYKDCNLVNGEIIRFAGKNSLAKTTTIHYCLATEQGLKALKDLGVNGLLGLYGDNKNPRTSYSCSKEESEKVRNGLYKGKFGLTFSNIDVIMNLFSPKEIVEKLVKLTDKENVNVMIHEQYFYSDYFNYEPDFKERIESALEYLTRNGYESRFFEEII